MQDLHTYLFPLFEIPRWGFVIRYYSMFLLFSLYLGDRRSSKRFHRFPETDRAHLSLPSVHRESWWGRRESKRRVGRPARWLRSLAHGLSESTVLTRPQATIDRILRRFDLAANSSCARQLVPVLTDLFAQLRPIERPFKYHRNSTDTFLLSRLASITFLRNGSFLFFSECWWTQLFKDTLLFQGFFGRITYQKTGT